MKLTAYLYLLPLALAGLSACSPTAADKAPVALAWQDEGYNDNTGTYDNTFVIKNISRKDLAGNWDIYYSQLPRDIKHIQNDDVDIEAINANYFRISPTDKFRALAPGDSVIVRFSVSNDTPNVSQEPEGCYWVTTVDGKESTPAPIGLEIRYASDAGRMKTLTAGKIYTQNEPLQENAVTLDETAIIPTLKQIIKEKDAQVTLPAQVSLLYCNELADEARILQSKLKDFYRTDIVESSPFSIKLDLSTDIAAYPHAEQYRLTVTSEQISIEGLTPHAVFNGAQTLLAMLKGNDARRLSCMTINDYPDLEYRGFMLDIARNFTPADSLKKLIDLIASYKLNVLQFHCTDDEGWRLEIPGLEELTEISSRRGHTHDESACLYPGYDGGYDPQAATSGNGYYTRGQFIDLLRYATQRHVRIIPEIESPGHARAAIVAMKARYDKYIGTDPQKATEYLLNDPEDTSTYVSAQSYTDNVINVAMPSAYRFMEKVIREIQAMYREAGAPLTSIHIGGDEVAEGAWMGSPICRAFMEEQGIRDAHGLFEYFFCRVSDFMQQQGLKFRGWQEVALHNDAATDRRLAGNAEGINCWNTVPDWDSDEIPYQIANNGYPIILCNVNNLYLDLAYNAHHDERGHSWGGYVDEQKTFSMLPYSVYHSSRTDLNDNPVDLDNAARGKEPLRRRENIKGVQAQLFAETIRGFQWVEYYMFPKIFGLVERGWHAHPQWEYLTGQEEQEAYYRDLSRYYAIISQKELPFLQKSGVNFRIPLPGLVLKDGMLYANAALPGAEIRYTTDNSEPTLQSPRWEGPTPCHAPVIKAKAFYLGKSSVTTILLTNL